MAVRVPRVKLAPQDAVARYHRVEVRVNLIAQICSSG